MYVHCNLHNVSIVRGICDVIWTLYEELSIL